METLQLIFVTVITGFVIFILIAKIASGVTNGEEDDHQRRKTRDFSKVLAEELNSKMEKSSSKRKSMKKVRFAVDHDGILVNKVVAGPSETKQVVFENNQMLSLNDVESVVKSPVEEFDGVKKADYDDKKPTVEAATPIVLDYDQTKEGNTDLVDQKSMQATMIPDQNTATDNKDQMSVKLPCDDVIEENQTISLNDVGSAVESPVEFVGDEKAEFEDDNKPTVQSVNLNVVDFIQPKEGKTEFVDQKSNQGTPIPEQNAAIDNKHQMCMKLLCDDGIDESEKEKEGLISEEDDSDDDWEGVERSDLEKMFAMAADYGKEEAHLQSLGNETQMQLYGLHKVATEGPCHEAQPMALKLSARSKWNAWQKLGNMDPDVAMEQYITLLSEKVPGWSHGIHSLGADLSNSRKVK
ncbi:hypothetical protein L1887_44310 [Cichorium endivia]|nr:hypothetical protein L1887_44310 [Cichorium endivia]